MNFHTGFGGSEGGWFETLFLPNPFIRAVLLILETRDSDLLKKADFSTGKGNPKIFAIGIQTLHD